MALVGLSDFKGKFDGSYDRIGYPMAGMEFYEWVGYALVNPGVSAANLDIIIPSQQKGKADRTGLVIPANSFIRTIGLRPLGALTLAAATGKLKLAPALASATAGIFAETAAAAAGTLAAPATASDVFSITPVAIGGADVTYRIYATDGGAGAAAVASTVTAPTRQTKVLVRVAFVKAGAFPTEDEVGYSTGIV